MQLVIGEGFRLVYQSGNEHNPGDPVGSVTLTITGEGNVRIDHKAAGGRIERRFDARTTRAVLEQILEHLKTAGFPSVPEHRIPMGSALRNLYIESHGEAAHSLPTSWHAVECMAGYREAYHLLDSITTLGSGGRLKIVGSPALDVAVPVQAG